MIGRGIGAGGWAAGAPASLRLLRNPRLQAAAAQVVILGGVAVCLLLLALRTVERLEALGIRTGFGFLAHRAGFNIGQAMPLPLANGALVVMLVAVALGLVAAVAVVRRANSRGRALRDHPPLLFGSIAALLLPPALGWFLVGDQLAMIRFTADDSFGLALVVGALNTPPMPTAPIAVPTTKQQV
jgi:ABC-type amino acid transport system permease subunit